MRKEHNSESVIIANQLTQEREYWDSVLQAFEEKTCIEYDFNKSGFLMDRYPCQLSGSNTEKLLELSGGSNLKLKIILMAAVVLFLKKISSGTRVTLGTPVDREEDDKDLINRILPLVFDMDEDSSFKRLILQTKDNLARAIENQNFPVDVLLEKAGFAKSDYPLFDVGFVLKNLQDESPLTEVKASLIFTFARQGQELSFTLEYNLSRYKEKTIGYLASLFDSLLQTTLPDLDQPIAEIPLLNGRQKEEVEALLQCRHLSYPEKSIPELIKEQVKKNPLKTAVGCANSFITYEELDSRTDDLARFIRHGDVDKGAVVMLLLDRNIDTVVAMLATLKARCAYLPVETGTPVERIQYMLRNSEVSMIITNSEVERIMSAFGSLECSVINIETVDTTAARDVELDKAEPDDHCYTVYTSGSTGLPKGVKMSHRNVVNHIYGMNDKIYSKYNGRQTMGLVSPFIFDACVQLTYGSLLFGHQLHIFTNEEKKEGVRLLKSYAKYAINITDGTPTHINLILQAANRVDDRQYLRHMISGGDVLHHSRVRELYAVLKGTKPAITNVYGPTECSVNATCFDISKDTVDDMEEIPIGRPFPNYRTYVLDQNRQLCPVGIPGELCFAGDCVTMGYVNNTSLTNEKIQYVPGIDDTVYFTGDYVKLLPDGNLKFLGRRDDLVKIRGYRIELGETETHLNRHEDITQAIVGVRNDGPEEATLVAWYVSENNLGPEQLRNYLLMKIPEFMIPSYLLPVQEIPLLPNGKVNRKLLPDPSEVLGSSDTCAPENETERILVDIYKSNLGLPEIGVNDNYFNIGGDSIKTISLLFEINEKFNRSFSIVDLYNYDTIRKFSNAISECTADETMKHELDEIEDELLKMKNDILKKI